MKVIVRQHRRLDTPTSRSFAGTRFRGILLLAAAVSCSDPAVKPGLIRVRDSAGVEIVTNLGPAPDTVILDSAVIRVGGIEVAAEYVFQRLSDVAVLADGSVIVSDMIGRVAHFDSAGQWIRDFGGSGSGPGEFREPVFVDIVADTVAVWDVRLARLSLFTTKGEFLDVAPIRKRGRLPVHWRGAVWFDEREWGQDIDARALVIRVEDNGTRDTVKGPYPIPGSKSLRMNNGRFAVQLPPTFSVRSPWQACEHSLLWADPRHPRIEQHGLAGGLLRVIELARFPREIAQSDREAYARAMGARWDLSEVVVAQIRDGRFVAETPLIVGFVCGVNGAIWVSHFDPAVPDRNAVSSTWDEIDASGQVITHIRFPLGFVLKSVTRGRAYGIARRELDVNVVEIYQLPFDR